jgi:hypothetical protein
MGTDLNSTIHVTVECGSSLGVLLDPDRTRAIEEGLTSELSVLLRRLGLAGEPAIQLRSAASSRVVRVRVHERLQPYSPDLMRRVWRALAPTGLRDLPETAGAPEQSGFPDAWFKGYLTGSVLSDREPSRELVSQYLVRLVYEVIKERPACLIGPAQTAAYLRDGPAHTSYAIPSDSTDELSIILESLLDLGVSVADKALVLQVSDAGREAGRPVEDIVEGVFAQLSADRIEIHVHPQYLQLIAPGQAIHAPLSVYAEESDASLGHLFRFVEQDLFYDLGILVPDLVWVPSPEMGEGMIAVKINERLSTPTPVLYPGEVLVNAPVESLAALEISGRPTTNPANGNPRTTLVSEADRETVQQAGYTAWTPPVIVVGVVSNEIRRMAHLLLDVEYVEYQLAQLQYAFPEVVRAATEHYSVEDLTRVLRGLVVEGLSIRDMRAILERLLRYDTISIDSVRYFVLDDRLVLKEEPPPAQLARSWENYREFVRSGLKYYLSYKYAQYRNRLYVYVPDGQLAAYVGAMGRDGRPTGAHADLAETEREILRDAVWAAVGDVAAATVRPVILTMSGLRAELRELIAPELPDLPVISYSELSPNLGVERIGMIGLP